MSNHLMYRRVRQSEHDDLAKLCEQDLLWPTYYNYGHSKWLKKALFDVRDSRDRVVIGAFKNLDLESGNDKKQELIGCIFLKGNFEDCVELKNLIILPNESDPKSIAGMLIDKAILFCEIRNVEKVEIEVPQQELRFLEYFTSKAFRIVSVRDRHKPNIKVCILEKAIGNKYHGDPFEKKKFALWLLKQYMPCEIGNIDYTPDNLMFIPFESKIISFAFSEENEIGYDKRLRGILWSISQPHPSIDNIDDQLSRIIESSHNLPVKIIIIDFISVEHRRKLVGEGFIVIDNQEAKEIAGGANSSKNIPMTVDQIGGAITVLEYNKVVELSKLQEVIYYLFSGVGNGLEPYSYTSSKQIKDERVRPMLAVYCANAPTKDPGIVGYFDIKRIKRLTFKQLLEERLKKGSAITKKDLEFYSIYSENERVTILTCEQFIPFTKVRSITDNGWLNMPDTGIYLHRQIVDNNINATYLDVVSCENLRNVLRKKSKQPFKNSIKYNQAHIDNLQTMIAFLTTLTSAMAVTADAIAVSDFIKKQIQNLTTKIEQKKNAGISEPAVSPPVQKFIDESNARIQELMDEYHAHNRNNIDTPSQKKEHGKVLANRIIDYLVPLASIKSKIDNYDDIMMIFRALSSYQN